MTRRRNRIDRNRMIACASGVPDVKAHSLDGAKNHAHDGQVKDYYFKPLLSRLFGSSKVREHSCEAAK